MTFDYGFKDENPIDKMSFYTKDKPDISLKIHKDQVSRILVPNVFMEKSIRVYCKKLEASSTALK